MRGVHHSGVSSQECPILCIGKRLVHVAFLSFAGARSIRPLNNSGEILLAKMNAGAHYINFHQYRQKYHSHFRDQCEHRKHGYEGLYLLEFDSTIYS